MATNYFRIMEDVFREKREAAIRDSEERKETVRRAIPEIRDIDVMLSSVGSKMLAAAMSGENSKKKIENVRIEGELLMQKRKRLLRENGYPEDYSDVRYDCPLCSDYGFIGIDMCKCMKIAIAEARLADSDLGRLAHTQSFDNFSFDYYTGKALSDAHRNYDLLYDFADNFNSDTYDNWLLVGDTGLGKTHLSTSVGVTVIRRGFDVVYKTVQSFIRDFEDEQFRNGDGDTVHRYYDCDLLMIDDLGVELSNQFTVSCLYNIINARINSRRSTLISTNLTQSELREKYADRITSRLFGEYKPLVFSGVDVRRQKLQRN